MAPGAISYTPIMKQCGEIDGSRFTGPGAILEVVDHGESVAPQDRVTIFEP